MFTVLQYEIWFKSYKALKRSRNFMDTLYDKDSFENN